MGSRNRGVRKPKLRDLSHAVITSEERKTLMRALINTNPIVTAILGAVLVEHELDWLLRGRLSRKDDDTWSDMTGEEGPLSTFHRKILMGHALGIYTAEARTNLHIVRVIRNAFAHSKKLIDFDHPLIVAQLSKIVYSTKQDRKLYEVKNDNQLRYSCLCYMLTCNLMLKKIKRLEARNRHHSKKASKTAQSAYANTLMQLIRPQGVAGFPLPLFPLGQIGDPTAAAPSKSSYEGLLKGLFAADDKKDK